MRLDHNKEPFFLSAGFAMTLLVGMFMVLIYLYQDKCKEVDALSAKLDSCIHTKEKVKTLSEEKDKELVRKTLLIHALYNKFVAIQPVKVTAYILHKQPTASGVKVAEGCCAVSRNLFKQGWTFGKKVYVHGYGHYTITDLMGEEAQNHIDIWVPSLTKAKDIGLDKTYALLI